MDYASWGYIALYLVVIVTAMLGNILFLLVVKKNEALHSTVHFFLISLAVRDIIISILVIPVLLDSLINCGGGWHLPLFACKLYAFLAFGLRGVHTFTLLGAVIFLFSFHRRMVKWSPGVRDVARTKSHKWAVPMAWVLAMGLAIPAGALARHDADTGWCQAPPSDPLLIAATITSVIPLVLIGFALIGLGLQICRCHDVKLKPPHDRISGTLIAMVVLLILTQGPFQSIQIITFVKHLWTTELRHVVTAILYIPCILHPVLLFSINPQYRNGLKVVFCAGDEEKEPEEKYNSHPSIIKLGNGRKGEAGSSRRADVLLEESQPMLRIMPSHNNPHFEEPELPAKFRFGEFEYTDTGRVEPKVAYSPTSDTAPLHQYQNKPFKQPDYVHGTWFMPGQREQGPTAESCCLTTSLEEEHINSNTSKSETFEIESLESSPGSSLRMARKKVPEINHLEASPGVARRKNSTREGVTGGESINEIREETTNGVTEGEMINRTRLRETTYEAKGGDTINGISSGVTARKHRVSIITNGTINGGLKNISNGTIGDVKTGKNSIGKEEKIAKDGGSIGDETMNRSETGLHKEGIKNTHGIKTQGITESGMSREEQITRRKDGVQETRLEDTLPGQVKDKIKAIEILSRKNVKASEKLN